MLDSMGRINNGGSRQIDRFEEICRQNAPCLIKNLLPNFSPPPTHRHIKVLKLEVPHISDDILLQFCRNPSGIAAMLDAFEILTTSGVVLWSRSYSAISPSIINSLITNVFIEERSLPGAGIGDDVSAANNPPYKYDQHTLKWTTVKELGLIFVVC